jgi:hypothetical protein
MVEGLCPAEKGRQGPLFPPHIQPGLFFAHPTPHFAPRSSPTAAASWRCRQELLLALELTAPQRGGDSSAWSMQLRNAHERYVQVGGTNTRRQAAGPC